MVSFCQIIFIYTVLLLLGCESRRVSKNINGDSNDVGVSREQLLAGKVEKSWLMGMVVSQRENGITNNWRVIFYRNYTLTKIGKEETRNGHWSINADTLSFYYQQLPPTKYLIHTLSDQEIKLESGDGVYILTPE